MTTVDTRPRNSIDDEFADLVNKDVRGVLSSEEAAILRQPENAARWYKELLVLKRSVEAQLTANRAERSEKYLQLGQYANPDWFEYRAQADRWRAGAVRFKAGVEKKLAEARGLRSEGRTTQYVTVIEEERDHALQEVKRLRDAIRAHRDHVCDNECSDECVADERLWEIVDEDPRLARKRSTL